MATQKVKDENWTDETGRKIPVKYVTGLARAKEQTAGKLLRDALSLNKKLNIFKTEVKKLCNDVATKAKIELKVDNMAKGTFSFFNFDRTIKIEVSASERIEFDDLTIQACKGKLDEFLSENLDSKQDFLKEMVTDAFSTSRGKLDAKKVMGLMKYRTKIPHTLFQQALDLLGDSIRHPDSKTYFRIWERQEDGGYKLIDLNFSSL
jgi:hypothetical protein